MTTTVLEDFVLTPELVLGSGDHHRLTVLALGGTGHNADAADDLLYELDRAAIVPDEGVPSDIVRMGSRVRFRTNAGDERMVMLVYPAQADIGSNRVSVLTPVGTALIGLRRGQSITWTTRDNRKQVLTVLAVTPPDDGGDLPPAAA